MEQNITTIFSLLAVLTHISLVVFLCFYVLKRDWQVFNWIGERAILISFIIALVATLGSLYYSEVVGWAPCALCWYQRIFMFSSVFLLGFALFRKRSGEIIPYVLLLTIIGIALAIFHSILQMGAGIDITCSISSVVPCNSPHFTMFGYVTLPVLSLTGFLLVLVPLLLAKNSESKKG